MSSEALKISFVPSTPIAVSSIGSSSCLGIFTLHFHKSSASELLAYR